MKTSTKFWLAIFTFLPIVLFIVFFSLFFSVLLENIAELKHNHGEFPLEFIQSIFWVFGVIILAAITSLGINIYYIVHTNSKPDNDTNQKIMWILLLIFTGSIGAIVYYFVEIIPLKEPE